MKQMTLLFAGLVVLALFSASACSRHETTSADAKSKDMKETAMDQNPKDNAQPGDRAEKASPPADGSPREIVLAGGCFWCVEAVYENLDGVIDVESGYAGGDPFNANYDAVKTGRTKHAEAVRITYDPAKIDEATILKVFFTTAHDPTQLNRQGNDVGPQYRSAIFFANEQQKQAAQAMIKKLTEQKYHRDPIVTTLEPLDIFFPAETYHQDYARRNPGDGYILGVSKPKVDKTRKTYPDLLK